MSRIKLATMNPVIEVSEIQDCANISTEEDDCGNIIAIEGEDDCGTITGIEEDDCEEYNWAAMIKNQPKYQGFIFDITLKITFFTDSLNYDSSVFAASIATIVIDIIHKYQAWRPAAPILIASLLNKIKNSPHPKTSSNPFKWEVTVSVAGNNFKTDFIDDPPIIYDCLAHVFVAEPSSLDAIIINYTTTFFLSPAIKIAKSLYTLKGFEKVEPYNYIRDYSKVMDMIQNGKNYSFERVWKNIYDEVIKYDVNMLPRNSPFGIV